MNEKTVEVVDIQKMKELLESTPYHKLKEVQEAHGIKGAFLQGMKKAETIKKALEIYQETREKMREDLNKEKGVDEESEDKPIPPEEAIIPSIEPHSETKLLAEHAKTGLVKSGLSKEVLEKNLKNIKSNLNNGIPGQRSLLLAKMQEIEDRLKGME